MKKYQESPDLLQLLKGSEKKNGRKMLCEPVNQGNDLPVFILL